MRGDIGDEKVKNLRKAQLINEKKKSDDVAISRARKSSSIPSFNDNDRIESKGNRAISNE